MNKIFFRALLVFTLLIEANLHGIKLKEVSNIIGVRDNQLIGYGLIVGLDGTGDSSTPFTNQALSSMLQSSNIQISPNAIKSKNIAAIVVTSILPAFSRQGDKLDIKISSIGDAKSLVGGTLIMTPLRGVDGNIYAIAQGNLNLNIARAGDTDTSADIIRGAIVEKELKNNLFKSKKVTLVLKHSNFSNANNIQNYINASFENKVARAIDAKTIKLKIPKSLSSVEFMARLEDIEISYDALDKIVVDSQSGTIIAGLNVKVEPVLITYKDITVQIVSTFVLVPSEEDIGDGVAVNIEKKTITTARKPTISNVARALNKIGATPRDIVAIFSAMKRAGAIVVDMEII